MSGRIYPKVKEDDSNPKTMIVPVVGTWNIIVKDNFTIVQYISNGLAIIHKLIERPNYVMYGEIVNADDYFREYIIGSKGNETRV
jgi:hypothetical protein